MYRVSLGFPSFVCHRSVSAWTSKINVDLLFRSLFTPFLRHLSPVYSCMLHHHLSPTLSLSCLSFSPPLSFSHHSRLLHIVCIIALHSNITISSHVHSLSLAARIYVPSFTSLRSSPSCRLWAIVSGPIRRSSVLTDDYQSSGWSHAIPLSSEGPFAFLQLGWLYYPRSRIA